MLVKACALYFLWIMYKKEILSWYCILKQICKDFNLWWYVYYLRNFKLQSFWSKPHLLPLEVQKSLASLRLPFIFQVSQKVFFLLEVVAPVLWNSKCILSTRDGYILLFAFFVIWSLMEFQWQNKNGKLICLQAAFN